MIRPEEIDEPAQDRVSGGQAPLPGAARIPQGPAHGAVGGAGQGQESPALQGGGEVREAVGGLDPPARGEVVVGDGGGEAPVPAGVAGEDRQVGGVVEGELGAVDGGNAVGAPGLRVLDDAGHTVVIGQGQGLQAELGGRGGEVGGLVGAVEEGVGRVGVELGVAVAHGTARRETSRGARHSHFSNMCTE